MNKESNNIIVFKVNKELYSKDAILETGYKFTNNYYFEIKSQDKNYLIELKPKTLRINIKNIKEDFLNELIDQQLRFNLNQKNHLLREMIIKKAFFPFLNKEDDVNE